jgi:hypothetical protein
MYCIVSHRLTVGGMHKRENFLFLCDGLGHFNRGRLVKRQQGYRVKRISACGGCLGNDRR